MAHAASLTLAATLLATTTLAAQAQSGPVFNRIASFPVAENIPADMDQSSQSSSEIIAASQDGRTLIYSDNPLGGIGMVDITDASAPQAAGFIAMEGEPTGVAVAGAKVLVGVDTTEDLTAPGGRLAVVDIASEAEEASCDLGGQPDSVAVSPDGSFAAVAIENQRDEELNDGAIPQLPAGNVTIFRLEGGVPDCASAVVVDLAGLAGLAETAPTDPEPEYVDINAANEIVVSLQENNHFAIIDAATGEVTADFSAGTVDLEGIDTQEDGALDFTASQDARPREPDTVQWLDENRFASANEGDYEGGSRGFTIFNKDGTVAYESGTSFEREVIRAGHYPEGRSDSNGAEPEGMEVATFGETQYMFVLSERGSAVGVYTLGEGEPQFQQLLPSGIGPEGAVAIPERNLLVTSNEEDLVEDGAARSHVMIFELAEGEPAYPHIVSADQNGQPLGWGALSGLAADPQNADTLFAVSDSVYAAQPTIFTLDAAQTPARITAATRITRDGAPAEAMDVEGIALDGEGGFWLANEGDAENDVPHALYRTDAQGAIVEEIPFPAELLEEQTRFGAEGVTVVGDTLWIVMQRAWENDPENMAKLVAYDTASKEWSAVLYPLDAAPEGGWVGLSEITAHGDWLYIVERDNGIGANAKLKKLTRVAVADLRPAPLSGDLPTASKEEVRDLLPDLTATNGYAVDKVEGFTVSADGTGYVVTDNDGVDDSSGETMFFEIGKMQ